MAVCCAKATAETRLKSGTINEKDIIYNGKVGLVTGASRGIGES